MKLARLLILMFGMILLTFLIVHYGFCSTDTQSSNILTEFSGFLFRILHGDFGISAVSQQPILHELMARWPATMELGIVAFGFSMIMGISLGICAAIYHDSWIDRLLIGSSLIAYSMPAFWLSLIFMLVFSVWLDLTPVSGRLDVLYDFKPITGFMLLDTLMQPVRESYHFKAFYSAIAHLILPALVLASVPTAIFARMTRASMLEILSRDYILNAQAKGLSQFRIIFIHALKNALPPIISTGGLQFITTVVSGSLIVEVIFGWPGIGNYMMQSVYARDLELMKVFLLSMGFMVLIVNTGIDLIQQYVNINRSS